MSWGHFTVTEIKKVFKTHVHTHINHCEYIKGAQELNERACNNLSQTSETKRSVLAYNTNYKINTNESILIQTKSHTLLTVDCIYYFLKNNTEWKRKYSRRTLAKTDSVQCLRTISTSVYHVKACYSPCGH